MADPYSVCAVAGALSLVGALVAARAWWAETFPPPPRGRHARRTLVDKLIDPRGDRP